jgi:hypothetical protein
MRRHSHAAPGLFEKFERENGHGDGRHAQILLSKNTNSLRSASRTRTHFDQPAAAPSWVVCVKYEQYCGGLIDDLVQCADVEPLWLFLASSCRSCNLKMLSPTQ